MEELALNILDVACNSITAGASLITVDIAVDSAADSIRVTIEDNGKGMSADFVRKVTDPFATTRTTRKVGMGIPLFKMAAEMAGGSFKIESTPNVGTTTSATFQLSHMDRMPMGDVAGTVVVLIGMAGDADIRLRYAVDGREYVFDTREVREMLNGIDITENEITVYLKEMIEENIASMNGGLII